MRVTNQLIANNLIFNIQNNLSTVARTQEEISTSKTMIQLSDKPERVSQLLSIKSSLSYLEQYNINLDDGLSYLNLSDSTMQTMGDLVNQAESLAVQGSSSTYTKDDLNAMADKVDNMIDQVVDLANTSLGGKYIFAGTKNSSSPFQRSGDKITYTGDMNGIYRQVMSGDSYRIDQPGVTTGFEVDPLVSASGTVPDVKQRPADLTKTGMFEIDYDGTNYTITNQTKLDGVTPATNPTTIIDTSTPGEIKLGDGDLAGLTIDTSTLSANDKFKVTVNNNLGVFGHATEVSPGTYTVYDPTQPNNSVDEGIFDTLFKLRDNLKAGNYNAVNANIGDVQKQLALLTERETGIGARTNHFQTLQNQYVDLNTKLTEADNNLEGADVAQLSINLSQQQLTYQASLESTASILQVSLLNYLK